MDYPQTFHGVIGSILKDAVDFEGNPIDFSQQRIRGVGRYFKADEREEFPVLFDLDLDVDLSVLKNAKAFSGLQYVFAEVVYNSIKAYRDSEKNTGALRNGGVKILAYETSNDYRIEIEDRAGGVSKNVLTTGLPGEQTIRRTRERGTGGGIGFQTMKTILENFGAQYIISHVKEGEGVVGTNVTIIIDKTSEHPT